MSAWKNLALAAVLAIAATTGAAPPAQSEQSGELAARAESTGLMELAKCRARRCRRRCAQRKRECHTERRCGYTTGCRNVRVCRSVCLYWENYCR